MIDLFAHDDELRKRLNAFVSKRDIERLVPIHIPELGISGMCRIKNYRPGAPPAFSGGEPGEPSYQVEFVREFTPEELAQVKNTIRM